MRVHSVTSYTTAITNRAMCIVELTVAAGGSDEAGSQTLALRFGLGREDAAALGRALLDTAETATRLATGPAESADRH